MTKEEIFDQIKRALAFVYKDDAEELTTATNFSDDLGMESLDMIEFLAEVEERFEVKITGKPQTVGELVNNVWEVLHK